MVRIFRQLLVSMIAKLLAIFVLLVWLSWCIGYQNKYLVKQERCDVEYVNESECDVHCNTYHMNRSHKAVNLTMMYKNPSEDMRILISSYMWMSNVYKLIAIQFEIKFISILSYSMFDLEKLFHEHSVPPIKRFFRPNEKYVITGWFPNSKKFPPGGQNGKYKIHIMLVNSKKDVTYAFGNWYFTTQDIIRY